MRKYISNMNHAGYPVLFIIDDLYRGMVTPDTLFIDLRQLPVRKHITTDFRMARTHDLLLDLIERFCPFPGNQQHPAVIIRHRMVKHQFADVMEQSCTECL